VEISDIFAPDPVVEDVWIVLEAVKPVQLKIQILRIVSKFDPIFAEIDDTSGKNRRKIVPIEADCPLRLVVAQAAHPRANYANHCFTVGYEISPLG